MSHKKADGHTPITTRTCPNIIITGTPGVGKTKTTLRLAEKTNMKYVNINDIVKEHKCHEGLDKEFDSLILDEDKLLDALDPIIKNQQNDPTNNGIVLDYHSIDFFHEDWMDLIIVLRSNTEILYDRLQQRGYNSKKISENMECEIMQVVLDETKQAFGGASSDDSGNNGIVIVELMSNTIDDLESNVNRIITWIDQWKIDNGYLGRGNQTKRTRT